jgi:NAD(P)-dependent dehydrogenase (short-subunit alcohol dehydrogenase family)
MSSWPTPASVSLGRSSATLDDYRRQFETNVFGVLRTVSAALPALRASRGTVAIIGSVSGHLATPGASAYAMSKAAVHALAGSLRREVSRAGVGVVASAASTRS